MLPPDCLCTCYFLCLKLFPSRTSHGLLPYFNFLIKCHDIREDFYTTQFKIKLPSPVILLPCFIFLQSTFTYYYILFVICHPITATLFDVE